MRIHYDDVMDLYKKFDLGGAPAPRLLDEEQFRFRLNFLKEEVREFEEAYERGDLAGSIDALVDLVVVAYGTGILKGVSSNLWDILWYDVHRANMSKQRGVTNRGVGNDLIKPVRWIPPQTEKILQGYERIHAPPA